MIVNYTNVFCLFRADVDFEYSKQGMFWIRTSALEDMMPQTSFTWMHYEIPEGLSSSNVSGSSILATIW